MRCTNLLRRVLYVRIVLAIMQHPPQDDKPLCRKHVFEAHIPVTRTLSSDSFRNSNLGQRGCCVLLGCRLIRCRVEDFLDVLHHLCHLGLLSRLARDLNIAQLPEIEVSAGSSIQSAEIWAPTPLQPCWIDLCSGGQFVSQ